MDADSDNDAGDDRPEPATALRARAANIADRLAAVAESFASLLDKSALRGDADRRHRIAAGEREIATIERRNAARLREAGSSPLRLEHLPSLHGGAAGPDPQ